MRLIIARHTYVPTPSSFLTWTTPTAPPFQTVPAKFCLALRTSHMETSLILFNHMSTARTMFPSRFLPHSLYPLGFLVFSAKAIGMLPRPTVSTCSLSASTFSNITMDIFWWYEGATFSIAAIERIGGSDFELKQPVLLHKCCAKLP